MQKDKVFNRLQELQKEFPLLTFQNNGYEYLSLKIRKDHEAQIAEISEILKNEIEGFVEFNNFKKCKDGTFDVRVQYKWDGLFTGVGYFNIKCFKDAANEQD